MRDKKNRDDREESTLEKKWTLQVWRVTARFNELYNLVAEDRSCPEAEEAMETELLAFCRKEMGVNGQQEGVDKEGGAAATLVEQDAVAVEAAWDLDDDH